MDTPIVMSTPSPQILVSKTILEYREPGLPGEMADSGTRVGKYKKNPEYLVVVEFEEVVKKLIMIEYVKEVRSQLELSMAKAGAI